MDDTHPWPPREGIRFFLWWTAGLLIYKLFLSAFLWSRPGGFALTSIPPLSWWAYHFSVIAVLTLALGAWQAWLLFQDRRRAIAWAFIPLIPLSVAAISLTNGPAYSVIKGPSAWFLALPLLTAILQFCTLLHVRARPGLWLVVFLATLMIESPFQAIARPWIRKATAQLGLPRAIGSNITSNASFMTANCLSAAALAWWMLPLRRKPFNAEENAWEAHELAAESSTTREQPPKEPRWKDGLR